MEMRVSLEGLIKNFAVYLIGDDEGTQVSGVDSEREQQTGWGPLDPPPLTKQSSRS